MKCEHQRNFEHEKNMSDFKKRDLGLLASVLNQINPIGPPRRHTFCLRSIFILTADQFNYNFTCFYGCESNVSHSEARLV